jgi:hypothetical protein
MDDIELGWCAGFFEGEGNFEHSLDRRRVCVTNCDLESLERFQKRMGVGTIHGPYGTEKNPTWKPRYQWRVSYWLDVKSVIEMLWPLLSQRRQDQAQVLLDNPPTRIIARRKVK